MLRAQGKTGGGSSAKKPPAKEGSKGKKDPKEKIKATAAPKDLTGKKGEKTAGQLKNDVPSPPLCPLHLRPVSAIASPAFIMALLRRTSLPLEARPVQAVAPDVAA